MRLGTRARDCLYVNWAVPRSAAPEPPQPLQYEVHEHDGEEIVFASALLFRFQGLHHRALPFFRISYPQLILRLYVTDADGMPAVLFVRVVVPYWVVPVSRLFGRQPALGGFFSYPEPSDDATSFVDGQDGMARAFSGNGDGSKIGTLGADEEWVWTLRRGGRLEVRGELSSPALGTGPALGGWNRVVDYVRRRPVGYVHWDGRLRSLRKSHGTTVPVWPLTVELGATDVLCAAFPRVDPSIWESPHSAWLCPEIPFTFEIGRPKLLSALPTGRRVVTPVPDGCRESLP
ncbi:MAG: DUF2071 domain-containing protein [Thermoanaerobaculia bacterium]|nr:DUF2071 domain-containing protein [Thermoanaerobaculia bacterium]